MPSSIHGLLPFRLSAFLLLASFPLASLGADECNLSKTNQSCVITIDRGKPIAPSTLQMFSGSTLTVVVQHALSHERYFLDYSTGAATITPDVTSSIAQSLFPSIQALTVSRNARHAAPVPTASAAACVGGVVQGTTKPLHASLSTAVAPFRACLVAIAQDARDAYKLLEPYVAPDSITPASSTQANLTNTDIDKLEVQIDAVVQPEFSASSNITTLVGDGNYKAKDAVPAKPATPTTPATAPVDAVPVDPGDAEAINELTTMQKAADAIVADLLGYRQRLEDLRSTLGPASVSLSARPDDSSVYQNMAYRTVTYSLDALNLVSNSQEATPDPSKKRALASIVIVFADSTKHSVLSAYRWDASAGVFFSTLPNRSYSVAPVYTGTTISGNVVHSTTLRPTAVPFAAANYRLTNDLSGLQWKSNVYLTFAVGVNPNTKTADFAVGPSLAWRAFMLSAFAHWGQETRLSQGFVNGQSLGTTFTGTVPTAPHWVTAFAIGISVRVPSLTGR